MSDKKFGRSSVLFEIFLFIEIKKPDLTGVFIKKTEKKIKKMGQIFPHKLFRRL